MSKLKWFKHYNEASSGGSIRNLIDEKDYRTVACYWVLLELISRDEKPEKRGFAVFSKSRLKRIWSVNERTLVDTCLKLASYFNCDFSQLTGNFVSFYLPNWLELQENRGGKRIAKKQQSPGEVEERSKKREVEVRSDEALKNIQKFEEQFKKPEEWVSKNLDLAFKVLHPKAHPPPEIKRNLMSIQKNFIDEDNFKIWINGVLGSENCKEPKYLAAAILKEIGVRK